MVAIKVLRAIAKAPCGDGTDSGSSEICQTLAGTSTMQCLLRLLEIPQSQGNEQRDTALTRGEMERLTCADLRQKCKDQDIAGYGSKATLIDRILNQDDEATSPRTKSLEAVLIEAWFLKPKSSPEMKTGSKNEDSICSHLPPFFTATQASQFSR
ncbi:hypothetical protein AM587_10004424 [Phytophthora nicotianae]|nr:hypothetical protein AM587_10004424 [Phytophthora nicotianae]